MTQTPKSIREKLFSEITEVPTLLQGSYLPSLDGFRGLSVALVIIYHVLLKHGYMSFNGKFGVEVFFVISGFIITTLLIKEQLKNNEISLLNFYMRRALKIIPIAYLYLLFVGLLNVHYHFLPLTDILVSALFLKNTEIFNTWENWITGHYWSLSVEEQFYIIFPFILKKSIRNYFYIVIVLLLVIPCILVLEYKQVGILKDPDMHIFINFFRYFTPILIGSLLSFLIFKKVITRRLYPNNLFTNIALLLLAYILYVGIHLPTYTLPTKLLSPYIIAIVILNNLTPSKDYFFRFLNSKLLISIGLASYSLYIWQQIFLLATPWKDAFPYAGNIWLNLAAALIVGFASYYFVEKTLAKFKKRFR